MHFFCKICIEDWLKKNNSCPMCRTEVSLTPRNIQEWSLIEDQTPEGETGEFKVYKEGTESQTNILLDMMDKKFVDINKLQK